jgi:hypothetical protein
MKVIMKNQIRLSLESNPARVVFLKINLRMLFVLWGIFLVGAASAPANARPPAVSSGETRPGTDSGGATTLTADQIALQLANCDQAIRQMEIALELKPNDPAATSLKAKAVQEKKYWLAMRDGLIYLAGGKSSGPPSEAEAEREQRYSVALAAGQAAFNAGKYDEAIKQAGLALVAKPGDAAAKKLKDEAAVGQRQAEALQVLDNQLQDLMKQFGVKEKYGALDPANSRNSRTCKEPPTDYQAEVEKLRKAYGANLNADRKAALNAVEKAINLWNR